ncbi:MAG: outer membrane adhesin-like protein [Parcubacteria group bacterium Licking1014_1]|nr:MAG: outer membrane adhesin-like protein [Parcubacteria group bacterium Licking1014_1]
MAKNFILTRKKNILYTILFSLAIFFVGCFFVGVPQVFAAPSPSVESISPSSGPTAGGTSVTIVGTGFLSGPTVIIGGNAATNIDRVNSTHITATTPAGTAGAKDVTVTNTDTKSGTLTAGFTYEAVSHTITASAGAHGSISPSGAVSVNDGASQSFTITADANYYIADVLVDSVSAGAITSYDFTNVTADHTIAASFAINTCTSFTYSDWGDCQPDNTQSRTVATSLPAGCTGGSPVLTNSCTYVPPSNPCTSFTYSDWGDCQSNNTQSRTVATSSPPGCTGGSPILSQSCAYTPPLTPPPAPAPSGGGGGPAVPGKIVFSGYAYPKSTIEVLRKSIADESYLQVPSESIKISDDGSFLISYIGLVGGDYLFALRIKDKDGRSTSILAFNISFSSGDLFEVKDILAPPTIGFEKASITKNEVMKLLGYATPNNMVELKIDSSKNKKIKADQTGFWSFDVDTTYLSYGEHSVRARQITSESKLSNFSLTRVFKLSKLAVPKADLNDDSIIDIHDWSVFLFRWGNEDSALRLQDDINGDGEVNIFDFSLFLQAIKI